MNPGLADRTLFFFFPVPELNGINIGPGTLRGYRGAFAVPLKNKTNGRGDGYPALRTDIRLPVDMNYDTRVRERLCGAASKIMKEKSKT